MRPTTFQFENTFEDLRMQLKAAEDDDAALEIIDSVRELITAEQARRREMLPTEYITMPTALFTPRTPHDDFDAQLIWYIAQPGPYDAADRVIRDVVQTVRSTKAMSSDVETMGFMSRRDAECLAAALNIGREALQKAQEGR